MMPGLNNVAFESTLRDPRGPAYRQALLRRQRDQGAGMVGYDRRLSYGPGTVGASLAGVGVNVMEFGAKGDGVTDDRQAFIDAIAEGLPVIVPAGTYYFSDHIKPVPGSKIILIGEHRDVVTITAAAGKIPFFCDAAVGVDARIAGAYIKGITFDGGHVRNPAFFPYNADPGASITQALNLRAVKGGQDRAFCVITECRFSRINGLPVWIADFDGGVEISRTDFYKTKDPGILYCDRVKFVENTVSFAADNGVSISRSNKYVEAYGNVILHTSSAGMFIGGVQLAAATGSLTLTGAAYTVGSILTMTATGGAQFTTEDQGINFLLSNGVDRAPVRVISVDSSTTATVFAISTVPVSLRAAATSTWDRGPVSGAQAGSICENVVCFSKQYNVNLSQGPKDLHIHSNTLRFAGIVGDSETFTTGTITAGTPTLNVVSSTGFAINDWAIIDPDYTHENAWVAQIINIVGTVLTMSANPPQSLINETVRKALRTVASFSVVTTGNFDTAAALEYAENMNYHDNIMVDFVTGGMRLGSSSGSIRNSQVHDNQIFTRQTAHLELTIYGILIADIGSTAMRTSNIDVSNNAISLDGTGIGVRYNPIDNNLASYIRIRENAFRSVGSTVQVIEQTGATNITADYQPTSLAGSLTTLDLSMSTALGFSGWNAATFNAGVLTITRSLQSYDPTSGSIVITDIATSGVNSDCTMLCIRHGSASANTITFTHASGKIRCNGAVNLVLGPWSGATFIRINGTNVWQQV